MALVARKPTTITVAQYRELIQKAELEDELLTRVLGLAELEGWTAYHVRNSKRGVTQGPGSKGFPDLVLVRGSYLLYRELKREGRKLDPDQVRWRDLLIAAGQDWGLWYPSSWDEVERTLRRPA